ncbi:hypothetical protein H0H92_013728 [Tricholoma furcatifolium]|nr:hypothetical protein H0H92_013728 [Tricholoma furcatifolium]
MRPIHATHTIFCSASSFFDHFLQHSERGLGDSKFVDNIKTCLVSDPSPSQKKLTGAQGPFLDGEGKWLLLNGAEDGGYEYIGDIAKAICDAARTMLGVVEGEKDISDIEGHQHRTDFRVFPNHSNLACFLGGAETHEKPLSNTTLLRYDHYSRTQEDDELSAIELPKEVAATSVIAGIKFNRSELEWENLSIGCAESH